MSNTASSATADRKSTRLNSSHTEIYTLSLHDALPIYRDMIQTAGYRDRYVYSGLRGSAPLSYVEYRQLSNGRSEEHTSELQSHRDLHSFPTRRSSDLPGHDPDRRLPGPLRLLRLARQCAAQLCRIPPAQQR